MSGFINISSIRIKSKFLNSSQCILPSDLSGYFYLFSSTTSPNLVNHLLSSSGSVPVTSAILLLGFWSYLSIPLESPLTSVYIISMLQRTWCFASTKPSLIWSGPTGLTWSPRNMAPSKQILPRDNSLSLSLIQLNWTKSSVYNILPSLVKGRALILSYWILLFVFLKKFLFYPPFQSQYSHIIILCLTLLLAFPL